MAKRKIVLDLDDFDDDNRCDEELIALNEYFDNFKINMFAIPMKTSIETLDKYTKEAGCVFYPHGFKHTYLEMDSMNYRVTGGYLDVVDRRGSYWSPVVPGSTTLYGKVFKAPYWRYSSESYEALNDRDYVVAVSREQVNPPPEYVKTYEYDWELDEIDNAITDAIRQKKEIITLHGHVTPYRNSLDLFYEKLMKRFPKDTEFLSIEEYLKTKGGTKSVHTP